jgi:hypothetical protein
MRQWDDWMVRGFFALLLAHGILDGGGKSIRNM